MIDSVLFFSWELLCGMLDKFCPGILGKDKDSLAPTMILLSSSLLLIFIIWILASAIIGLSKLMLTLSLNSSSSGLKCSPGMFLEYPTIELSLTDDFLTPRVESKDSLTSYYYSYLSLFKFF
jgi:hypothetical protein